MLKHFKKYWLEYIFLVLLLNEVLCAVGYVREEIPIKRHAVKEDFMDFEEEELSAYLERIFNIPDCVILISGTELDENLFSDKVIEQLKNTGITDWEEWSPEGSNGLIALWINGELIEEESHNGKPISYGGYIFNQHYAYLEGYKYLNKACIYLDDSLYSLRDSGLNVVVMDQKRDCLIDSVNYGFKDGKIVAER